MAKVKQANVSKSTLARKMLRSFTKSTIVMITDVLSNTTVEELVPSLYFISKDKDIIELSKLYEKQLILSKVNPEAFAEGLHDFYVKTDSYLKASKLYRKFYKLLTEVYQVLIIKGNDTVLEAYQDLVLQQCAYFASGSETVVYGVHDNNKLMVVPEIAYKLSSVNYEVRLNLTETNFLALLRKYGHKVSDIADAQDVIAYDQTVTNMLCHIAYFINDETEFIFKKPFRNPSIVSNFGELEDVSKLDYIRSRLAKRNRLLPRNGLTSKIYGVSEIKEIFLYEVFSDDSIYLLYRVKFRDDMYLYGYYNVLLDIFYSPWKHSSHEGMMHRPFMNMILQTYFAYTCNKTQDDIKNITFVRPKPASIQYIEFEVELSNSISKSVKDSHGLNIGSMQVEIKKFDFNIRKLPIGAQASDEAKALAERYGIALGKGETFVREFDKRVYKKAVGKN